MARKIPALFVSLIVSVMVVKASLAAGPITPKNFSADLEITSPKGSFASKIISKDGKQRIEHNVKGKEEITIVRSDKKVMWVLKPDNKTYMEMSLDRRQRDISSQLHDPEIKTEKEFLGNETVDNHPSRKYHLTVIKDGKKEAAGFLWEASDLNNFPVKHQNEKTTTTTVWKNIKFDAAADSLFEIPAGYTKMEMPGMSDPAMHKK